MKTTLDSAGRIVVPELLREALAWQPGQMLEISIRDGRLEIYSEPTPMALSKPETGPIAVPHRKFPTLTAEKVRDTLDRVRR